VRLYRAPGKKMARRTRKRKEGEKNRKAREKSLAFLAYTQ